MTPDTPRGAAPVRGRRLAVTVVLSLGLLLCAAVLWYGAGYRAGNECLTSQYRIPTVTGAEMTEDGCTVLVNGQRSEALPGLDDGLALVALIVATLAAVPPYILLLARRR